MGSSPHKPLSVVMVADDSLAVSARLASMLAEVPNVLVLEPVSTVAEAIRQFATHHPAAVLLDLQLADLSGINLLTYIRAHREPCFVIVLTNLADDAVRSYCQRAGADHVLRKFEQFELAIDLIRQFVDRQG